MERFTLTRDKSLNFSIGGIKRRLDDRPHSTIIKIKSNLGGRYIWEFQACPPIFSGRVNCHLKCVGSLFSLAWKIRMRPWANTRKTKGQCVSKLTDRGNHGHPHFLVLCLATLGPIPIGLLRFQPSHQVGRVQGKLDFFPCLRRQVHGHGQH